MDLLSLFYSVYSFHVSFDDCLEDKIKHYYVAHSVKQLWTHMRSSYKCAKALV